MIDSQNNDVQVGDIVYIASMTSEGSLIIERCELVEIRTHGKAGNKYRHPYAYLVLDGCAYHDTPYRMTEPVFKRRAALSRHKGGSDGQS